jgi:hypothetical protein
MKVYNSEKKKSSAPPKDLTFLRKILQNTVIPPSLSTDNYDAIPPVGLELLLQSTNPNIPADALQRQYPLGKVKRSCPLQLNAAFLLSGPRIKRHETTLRDRVSGYPKLYNWFTGGNPAPEELVRYTKHNLQSRKWIAYPAENGGYGFVRTSVKGSIQYYEKQSQIYKAYGLAFDKIPGTPIFLTLTLNQRPYNGNLLQAWQDMRRELPRTMRRLTRSGFDNYIIALEAHKSGFPHAHVCLKKGGFFPAVFADKKKALRITRTAATRPLFLAHKIGFTDVRASQDKEAVGYILKYLSKQQCPENLLNATNYSISDDNVIKSLLGNALSMWTRCRLFRVSKSVSSRAGVKQNRQVLIIQENARIIKAMADEKPQDITDLIILLNKSTYLCSAKNYLIETETLKGILAIQGSQNGLIDKREAIDWVEKQHRLGCDGCIIAKAFALATDGELTEYEKSQEIQRLILKRVTEYISLKKRSRRKHGRN